MQRLLVVFLLLPGVLSAEPAAAFRASILHFTGDPSSDPASAQFWPDGILLVQNGKVEAAGPAAELLGKLPPGTQLKSFPGRIILPGFIDTHVHYPQTDMVASYGEQLLEWLNSYTFPEEQKFARKEHAEDVAKFFLEELLRNGTTTALVFCTVHPGSVDAFFARASKLNLRMIAGKVLMDRNAPAALLDTPERSYAESKALIQRWHGKGRALYAITPRFAPTSSAAQLAMAGRLKKEFPDVWMHTHLSENTKEVAWVGELFPGSKGYLDVYDQHALVGRRSVFAHALHLREDEWTRLSSAGASIAFCPTSNMFLGSGLFDLGRARRGSVRFGVGTDIGAGTSFSILRTLGEAYKVAQLKSEKLSAMQAFYLATLGGARALDLDGMIGSFNRGKEADFVVLNLASTPLISRRMAQAKTLEEKLFVLMTLGDDRSIDAAYSMGRPVYTRAR